MLIWVFTKNGKRSKYQCSDLLGSCGLRVILAEGCEGPLEKKHVRYRSWDLHQGHIVQARCMVEGRWRHGLAGRSVEGVQPLNISLQG